jgi:hypothetical protein
MPGSREVAGWRWEPAVRALMSLRGVASARNPRSRKDLLLLLIFQPAEQFLVPVFLLAQGRDFLFQLGARELFLVPLGPIAGVELLQILGQARVAPREEFFQLFTAASFVPSIATSSPPKSFNWWQSR